MKKSKLLIPAIAFLVVSMAAAATSTVAWFTANTATTVTLNNVIAALRLNDRVRVLPKDLKEVDETFDIVTFRAFHPLFDILDDEYSIQSVYKDGILM